MSNSSTKIYTDGSHREICYVIGNHKPIRAPVKENGCAVTGNEAEYRACLSALQVAKDQGLRRVEILSDSQVMVKQIRGEYAANVQRLHDLKQLIIGLVEKFDEVKFTWIPREQNLAGIELEKKLKAKGEIK
jgi:ribonuclease HI